MFMSWAGSVNVEGNKKPETTDGGIALSMEKDFGQFGELDINSNADQIDMTDFLEPSNRAAGGAKNMHGALNELDQMFFSETETGDLGFWPESESTTFNFDNGVIFNRQTNETGDTMLEITIKPTVIDTQGYASRRKEGIIPNLKEGSWINQFK